LNIEEWSGYEVSNEVLEQAASWIAKLDNSQESEDPEDIHTLFFDWLQTDPSHQQAYFELSEIWARSACTKSMYDMIDKSMVLPFPNQENTRSQGLLAEPSFAEQSASSSWAYTVTIGLIFCGLFIPAIQSFF
jgi:ferric-dicitrate binding protein FerR (iron transport regulator)